MSWSLVGILVSFFALGFCAGNIFQIWVRPKEEVKKEITLEEGSTLYDFIKAKQSKYK